jgi:hypothetical protein
MQNRFHDLFLLTTVWLLWRVRPVFNVPQIRSSYSHLPNRAELLRSNALPSQAPKPTAHRITVWNSNPQTKNGFRYCVLKVFRTGVLRGKVK